MKRHPFPLQKALAALLSAGLGAFVPMPATAASVSYVGAADGFQFGGSLALSFTGELLPSDSATRATLSLPATAGDIANAGQLSNFSLQFSGNSDIAAFNIDLAEARRSGLDFFLVDLQAFANGSAVPTPSADPDFVLRVTDEETGVIVDMALASFAPFDEFLDSTGFAVRGVRVRQTVGPNEFVDEFSSGSLDPVGAPPPPAGVPEPGSVGLVSAALVVLARVTARRRRGPEPLAFSR